MKQEQISSGASTSATPSLQSRGLQHICLEAIDAEHQSEWLAEINELVQDEGYLQKIANSPLLLSLLKLIVHGEASRVAYVLAERLIECGVGPEVVRLFTSLPNTESCKLAPILQHGIEHSRPPHFLFDTQDHGYSTLEFTSCTRMGPRQSTGYSIALWLQLQVTSPQDHCTLFGVYNDKQSYFLLLYIEKGTQCLILQTSLKNSVRFKYRFEVGPYYHVVIVHTRSSRSLDKATIYVNGASIESLRLQLPITNEKPEKVRAFLGTLPSFATLDRPYVQYAIASVLFSDALMTNATVDLCYKLGPSYSGNFQDINGTSFTYRASADLQAQIESGKMSLDSVKATRLFSEERLLLRVCAACASGTLADHDNFSWSVTNLATSGDPIHEPHIARISGGTRLIAMRSLSAQMNLHHGVEFLLDQLSRTSDPNKFCIYLEVLRSFLACSPVAGETMETSLGYERLAMYIAALAEQGTDSILASVLKLVGIYEGSIYNALAYRHLLANPLVWTTGHRSIRKMYFDHVRLLVHHTNPSHSFNMYRIAKSGLLKRILYTLLCTKQKDTIEGCLNVTTVILDSAFTSDNIRIVATATIYLSKLFDDAAGAPRTSTDRPTYLNLLDLFSTLLDPSREGFEAHSRTFAATITIRWVLHFMRSTEALDATLGILASLLLVHDHSYTMKFIQKNEGLRILRTSSRGAPLPIVLPRVLSMLTHNIYLRQLCTGHIQRSMSECALHLGSSEIDIPLDRDRISIVTPEVLPLLTEVLKASAHELVAEHLLISDITPLKSVSADLGALQFALHYLVCVMQEYVEVWPHFENDVVMSNMFSMFCALAPHHPAVSAATAQRTESRQLVDLYTVEGQDKPSRIRNHLATYLGESAVLAFKLVTFYAARSTRFASLLDVHLRELSEANAQILCSSLIEQVHTALSPSLHALVTPFSPALQLYCSYMTSRVKSLIYFDENHTLLQLIAKTLEQAREWPKKSLSEAWATNLHNSLALLILHGMDRTMKHTVTTVWSAALFRNLLFWQELAFHQQPQNLVFYELCSTQLALLIKDSADEDLSRSATELLRALDLFYPELLPGMIKHGHLPGLFAELSITAAEDFVKLVREHDNAMMYASLAGLWDVYNASRGFDDSKELSMLATMVKEFDKRLSSERQLAATAIQKFATSTESWLQNVLNNEALKMNKLRQDADDQCAHVIQNDKHYNERYVLARRTFLTQGAPLFWQLELKEGRLRQRKRLKATLKEEANKVSPISQSLRQSLVTLTTKDDFDVVDATEADHLKIDQFEDDKNRKVLRKLEHGDIVQEVFNITRIVGLQSIDGLLILGKTNLYLVDNYLVRHDGEVLDAWHSSLRYTKDPVLQALTGQTGSIPGLLNANHDARSWQYSSISSVSKRQFLFRDIATELFFEDGQSLLLTSTRNDRDKIHRSIGLRTHKDSESDFMRRDTVAKPANTLAQRFTTMFLDTPAHLASRRWQKRAISNYEYLMVLNTLAGRSTNDLTQYPVFPWIIADYVSQELDLQDPKSYRDLRKNMGTQSSERAMDFVKRYRSFSDIDERPFHFGTHYSSAMIVCSYLIRLSPFTEAYLALQGGQFDHPERLFHSIERTWLSASRDNMTDVRELTPEWFYLPEFLANRNGLDLGHLSSGESICDVKLPPWAHDSPYIFIEKQREALESDYVSAHLHHWIDLIFGVKQTGEAAVENTNVFHALSYHGAIDLDKIDDTTEKLATISIIHNFGQTPRQLFTKPHPERNPKDREFLPLQFAKDYRQDLVMDVDRPMKDINPVYSLAWNGQICARSASALSWTNPGAQRFMFTIGNCDRSLRIYTASRRCLQVLENLHADQIDHMALAGDDLILVSADRSISIMSLKLQMRAEAMLKVERRAHLRLHRAPIAFIEVCKTYSMLVSATTDAEVFLWDLDRGEFTMALQVSDRPRVLRSLAMSARSGHIAISTATTIELFQINGAFLHEHTMTDNESPISALEFYQDEYIDSTISDLILSGHDDGSVRLWRISVASTSAGWQFERIALLMPNLPKPNAITCILCTKNAIYTGDSHGDVYRWH